MNHQDCQHPFLVDYYPLCCDGVCGPTECNYHETCLTDADCAVNEVSKRCCGGKCANPANYLYCPEVPIVVEFEDRVPTK